MEDRVYDICTRIDARLDKQTLDVAVIKEQVTTLAQEKVKHEDRLGKLEQEVAELTNFTNNAKTTLSFMTRIVTPIIVALLLLLVGIGAAGCAHSGDYRLVSGDIVDAVRESWEVHRGPLTDPQAGKVKETLYVLYVDHEEAYRLCWVDAWSCLSRYSGAPGLAVVINVDIKERTLATDVVAIVHETIHAIEAWVWGYTGGHTDEFWAVHTDAVRLLDFREFLREDTQI